MSQGLASVFHGVAVDALMFALVLFVVGGQAGVPRGAAVRVFKGPRVAGGQGSRGWSGQ